MELGALVMNETKRTRHKKQDLCLNCHKPGHRANHTCSRQRQEWGEPEVLLVD
jgi:hypothetical protein